MEYKIVGSNMQYLHIILERGERMYSDSGKLITKNDSITMTPRLTGGIINALERKIVGATAMLTEFEAKKGEGEVSIAGVFPGKVYQLKLAEGQEFICERFAFLAADESVKISVAVMNLGAAYFGGAGLYLAKLVGPGNVFIHVVGDIIEHDVVKGEAIQVEPGHIAGFDASLKYNVRLVDNIRTMMFGGVGMFLATFEGEGRLVTHSVSRLKLAAELYNTAASELKKKSR